MSPPADDAHTSKSYEAASTGHRVLPRSSEEWPPGWEKHPQNEALSPALAGRGWLKHFPAPKMNYSKHFSQILESPQLTVSISPLTITKGKSSSLTWVLSSCLWAGNFGSRYHTWYSTVPETCVTLWWPEFGVHPDKSSHVFSISMTSFEIGFSVVSTTENTYIFHLKYLYNSSISLYLLLSLNCFSYWSRSSWIQPRLWRIFLT